MLGPSPLEIYGHAPDSVCVKDMYCGAGGYNKIYINNITLIKLQTECHVTIRILIFVSISSQKLHDK